MKRKAGKSSKSSLVFGNPDVQSVNYCIYTFDLKKNSALNTKK